MLSVVRVSQSMSTTPVITAGIVNPTARGSRNDWKLAASRRKMTPTAMFQLGRVRARACARYGVLVVGEEMKGLVNCNFLPGSARRLELGTVSAEPLSRAYWSQKLRPLGETVGLSRARTYDWVAAARVRACARYGVLVVGEEMKQRCYPSHR